MALFKPFDWNPSSTDEQTSTYTCPAGKYAVVELDAYANAIADFNSGAIDVANNSVIAFTAAPGNAHSVKTVRLKPGDVITSTLTDANSNATITGISTLGDHCGSHYDTSTVEVFLNGNRIMKVSAAAQTSVVIKTSGGAGPSTYTYSQFSGDTGLTIYASEYLIPT